MTFRVHNTFARRKEVFEPLEAGRVRMYNCGPTVYARPHVGNFRAWIFADVLRRWLEYIGYEVQQVMNITDVGHIQADEDEGEDKVEARARREGLDPWEITRRHAREFLEDLSALGVREAMVYPRATDHVPEMLEIVEGLLDTGFAYQVGENVYFDVSRFPAYGELSGNTVAELEAGARVEVHSDKRHPADFALWKSDPRHLMKWESRFGPDGFPGWHIECSAMARKHLGDQIDIHTGGEDNVFPHHECEIAQSEAFTGQRFARYWMHTRFLQVDGGKMSKSLGNVYTLDDVTERGYEPRVLRYALLRGHYRQPLNFTWGILDECRTALANLDELWTRLGQAAGGASPADESAVVDGARARFDEAMNDDLGTPDALAALFELRRAFLQGALAPAEAAAARAFLERADSVLAVIDRGEASLDAEVEELIERRAAARAAKDWPAADAIRDRLEELGIELEDTPGGVVWKRRRSR